MSTKGRAFMFAILGFIFAGDSKCVLILMGLCLSPLLIVNNVSAGGRPGSQDAACDAIDLKFRSSAHKSVSREMNFLLFEAVALGCHDQAKLFLENGATIDARDRFGNTALLIAARMGHTDVMKLLVGRGSSVHDTNLAGSSALLRAVTMNRRKVTQQLLEAGVDANLANKEGVTPLIAAAFNGSKRLVKLLLEHGADPYATDASNKGPVVYAAGKGYLPIVKLLMEYSQLDINTKYGNNLTVLMWAAGHSNDVPEKEGLQTVLFLLNRKPDLNAVDNRGKTALMIAAERGHVMVAENLIKAGASRNLKDNTGKTAEELAANDAVKRALNPGLD